jgi:hypothetical protein
VLEQRPLAQEDAYTSYIMQYSILIEIRSNVAVASNDFGVIRAQVFLNCLGVILLLYSLCLFHNSFSSYRHPNFNFDKNNDSSETT